MQRFNLLLLLLLPMLLACEKTTGPDGTDSPAASDVTMTNVTDLPMIGGNVTGIGIASDNKVIAAIDGNIYSMNMSGGQMQAINSDGRHMTIRLAPSGEAYGVTDTEIRTYDLASGTHKTVPIDPAGPLAIGRRVEIAEVIFSPSGEPYIKMINNNPQLYVYYSTDKGTTWKALNMPPGFMYGGGLAFAPNGDILLSSAYGLYRSSDKGATWTSYPAPLSNYGGALLVTLNGDIYYYVPGGGGLRVSRNGGASFTELSPFNQAPFFNRLQQGADGALYALASKGGGNTNVVYRPTSLVRSTDGGVTWKHLMFANGHDFAMRGSTIAIGLASTGAGANEEHGGMLLSENSGATWTAIGTKPVGRITDLGFDKDRNLIILADNGLYRKTSAGWQALGTLPGNFSRFAANAKGDMVTGNMTVIFHSTDNGVTWSEHLVQDYTMGIDPPSISVLLAKKDGDFLMSITSYTDARGYSNGHIYNIGPDGVPVRYRSATQTLNSIVQDRDGVLYGGSASVDPFSHTFFTRHYKSVDKGATWVEQQQSPRMGLAVNSQNRSFSVKSSTEYLLTTLGGDASTNLTLKGFDSQGNYITRAMFDHQDKLYLVTLDKGLFISSGPVR